MILTTKRQLSQLVFSMYEKGYREGALLVSSGFSEGLMAKAQNIRNNRERRQKYSRNEVAEMFEEVATIFCTGMRELEFDNAEEQEALSEDAS